MKTIYNMTRGSSLINYDVIQSKQNEQGLIFDSKVVGQVDSKGYSKIMKNGFKKKYLLK